MPPKKPVAAARVAGKGPTLEEVRKSGYVCDCPSPKCEARQWFLAGARWWHRRVTAALKRKGK